MQEVLGFDCTLRHFAGNTKFHGSIDLLECRRTLQVGLGKLGLWAEAYQSSGIPHG